MAEVITTDEPNASEQAAKEIERLLNLEVGSPTKNYRAITGEPYITFAIGGQKDEGCLPKAFATTKKAAWQLFLNSVLSYGWAQIEVARMDQRGKSSARLFWRKYPEYAEHPVIFESGEEAILCQWSARLLVSEKAELIDCSRKAVNA